MIQSARSKRRRKDSDDENDSQEVVDISDLFTVMASEESAYSRVVGYLSQSFLFYAKIDVSLLQTSTLRRYKRHFKLQARPGLNKTQLVEVRLSSIYRCSITLV